MPDDDREDGAPLIEGLDELPPGGFGLPPSPAELRQKVFTRTARVVRARVRRKRALFAVAALAVYLAGLLTGEVSHVEPVETSKALAPPPAAQPAVLDPASVLRQVLRAPIADRLRLIKQAGDAYLLARGDLERALDCYRQVLELATPETKATPDPDDTWLLAALKQGQTNNPRRSP